MRKPAIYCRLFCCLNLAPPPLMHLEQSSETPPGLAGSLQKWSISRVVRQLLQHFTIKCPTWKTWPGMILVIGAFKHEPCGRLGCWQRLAAGLR